ncbi:hypothetical protein P879_04513 [Paragonimus westermani]|uniref:Uncharacterized protein n=1 Tax=Paragonimus westermani TaxID=34504 RepID=A0A8T0D1R0_9TREM|nr:hypothetical protein P879_04513 [Paragonimus westermani]
MRNLLTNLCIIFIVLQITDSKSTSKTSSNVGSIVVNGKVYQNGKKATIGKNFGNPGTSDYRTFNASLCTSCKFAMSTQLNIFKSWTDCKVTRASDKETLVVISLNKNLLIANKLDYRSSSFASQFKAALLRYKPPSGDSRYYYGEVAKVYCEFITHIQKSSRICHSIYNCINAYCSVHGLSGLTISKIIVHEY